MSLLVILVIFWTFHYDYYYIVQLVNHVQLFEISWTAAYQASLSFTIPQSLLKLMSIELVMPSNHLILCHPLLLVPSIFPSIRFFSSESSLHISDPSIGASASASVLPRNIPDWFPLRLTGLISLQSTGLSRVLSSTTVQSINYLALNLLYSPTLTSIHDY